MSAAGYLILSCFVSSSVSLVAADTSLHRLPSFTSFIQKYGRTYAEGSKEYEMRSGIYDRSLQKVQHHNSRQHRLWDATINHLSDRTDAEFAELRGLRLVISSRGGGKSAGASGGSRRSGQFLGQVRSSVLPANASWDHLEAITRDTDQGGCGSCWAVATSTMLLANAEIKGIKRSFSAQELVNCVPNPHNCGGAGGCDGATIELAMNWAMAKGLADETDVPYKGVDDRCRNLGLVEKHQELDTVAGDHYGQINSGKRLYSDSELEDMIAEGFHGASETSAGLQHGLAGWTRLPENEYEPLIRAVAETGPAAISVAAMSWDMYGEGIFDNCNKDAVIDHAVVLTGFGYDEDLKQKYWTIKNSWGNGWGELGNIRLLREEGKTHCGTDRMPKVGTGCDGGPKTVDVCGMCGILYDTVVPHFAPAVVSKAAQQLMT
jgi:cathepsin L